MDIKWSFKIELADEKVFQKIEKVRQIVIPAELTNLVKEANAASPSKNKLLLGTTEKIFGAMLSFNENEADSDSVYTALAVIKDNTLLPFGIDPFGNYFCWDSKSNFVVFWDLETDEVTSTSMNLEDFLTCLY